MKSQISKALILCGMVLLVVAALVAFQPGSASAVAPTATPTPAAAQPTATPVPFTAVVNVVPMYPAMGEVNKDTGRPTGVNAPRGDDPTKTYAVFSPGTRNVAPGVPVYVDASSISLASGAKLTAYEWSIKAPSGSTAKIEKVAKAVPGLTTAMASFTPDVTGDYTVSLVVTDSKGAKSQPGDLTIVAAKYVGNDTCTACHKDQAAGWAQTKHGTAFERFVNENAEGEYFSAGFGCARCHTVGYYPVAQSTGGWWDVFTNVLKLDWNKDLKNTIALNAFNEEKGKDTFSTLDPKLQAVSNIGCESCHGPGGAHVAKPGKETAPMTTGGSASCLQCHAASGHHTRGNAVLNSMHAENAALQEGDRKPCNTCHSPEGAIDTAMGVAADQTRAENGDLGCAVCHDPHGATNAFQLRQVNTVKLPTVEIKDAGLSASCMSCHNNRTDPKSVETEKPAYPHYSSAAELLAGVGGYDWGVSVKNGFHTNLGKGVINDEHSNQPGNMDFTQVNGGEAPGSCVLCHMYRTPGGVWDTTASMAVPGHQQVGGHTFNMVTTQNGKTVEHVETCQQCHPGITDFNFKAQADYDGNGRIDGVQTEVKGLLNLTKNVILAKARAEKINITTQTDYPYFVIPAGAKLSTNLQAAIYNFRYVNGVMWTGEGKSAAIHNFDRSVGLLQVTLNTLGGELNNKNILKSATLLYTPAVSK